MNWSFDFVRDPAEYSKEAGFATAMNTIGDLSYCPSAEEKARNAEQIVVTGRRNWKLMKGKKEAVWPPNLEAILIEALKNYKPHSTKPLSDFGRFPMRNRFISDYIYETTGKRRSPKQVGSRLQQLRDTCKKTELLRLISRGHPGSYQRDSPDLAGHLGGALLTKSETASVDHSLSNIIRCDIVLENRPAPPSVPVVYLTSESATSSCQLYLSRAQKSASHSPGSRTYLPDLNPTLEIQSPCPLLQQAIFSVFFEGGDRPIHHEVGSLRCRSSPTGGPGWIYSTSLVPEFWDSLCQSKDPTKYIIQQSVIPLRQFPLKHSGGLRETDSTIMLVYCFYAPQDLHDSYRTPRPHPVCPRAPLQWDNQSEYSENRDIYPPNCQALYQSGPITFPPQPYSPRRWYDPVLPHQSVSHGYSSSSLQATHGAHAEYRVDASQGYSPDRVSWVPQPVLPIEKQSSLMYPPHQIWSNAQY